ncbi:MAG: F0F1 ATP synthase subunit epsilon [Candidatus Bipolaricaulota bacterium]|nr:MAG: F0F1 ATP synthase subunit epsilon [Candidatus Bipolaricaulota bacterium]
MECRVLYGDEELYTGSASIVVARSAHGEFAIMEGHEPMLAALGSGPLRIETGDGRRVFSLRAGTLRVDESGVTVVASGLLPTAEVDEAGDEESPH